PQASRLLHVDFIAEAEVFDPGLQQRAVLVEDVQGQVVVFLLAGRRGQVRFREKELPLVGEIADVLGKGVVVVERDEHGSTLAHGTLRSGCGREKGLHMQFWSWIRSVKWDFAKSAGE